MSYFDDTLLRLRRQYSKDETVAALNKKIEELEAKNYRLAETILLQKSDLKREMELYKKEVRAYYQKLKKERIDTLSKKGLLEERTRKLNEQLTECKRELRNIRAVNREEIAAELKAKGLIH